MSLQPDDTSPVCRAARGWLRAAVVAALAIAVRRRRGRLCRFPVAAARRRGEAGPQRRRHRGADRRLVAGFRCDGVAGRRLRQAAVDFGRASDQRRQRHFPLAARQPVAAELLRRSRPLRRQHPQQRGGDAALGARARLQVADRGDVELPHAAGHRRIVARDARYRADSVRGGRRQMARRAVVDQWRDAAAAAIGIRQICRRRGAGAPGRCRSRPDARDSPTSRPGRLPPRRPATAQAN